MGGGTQDNNEKSLVKATIQDTHSGESYTVMFNPSEYILTKNASYQENKTEGANTTYLQFSHGNRRVLTMDLFFDTTDNDEDVSEQTKKIEALMDTQKDGDEFQYPSLIFSWGSFKFNCVLTNLIQRFTKFDPDGTPKRCILRCTFEELSLKDEE